MPDLAVNIDHIATIREARQTDEPDPALAAGLIEQAGAHGLVLHLRQDRRHVQDRDLEIMLRTIRVPINLEMAGVDAMIKAALNYRPRTVTLVPETREEVTTEGGMDLSMGTDHYRGVIETLKSGIQEISLFIDPDPRQIELAAELGADSVELHTGAYAEASVPETIASELTRLTQGAKLAHAAGLQVRGGHGLTYINVKSVALIPYIFELSIGHSIISRAVFTGISQAVRDMLNLVTTR